MIRLTRWLSAFTTEYPFAERAISAVQALWAWLRAAWPEAETELRRDLAALLAAGRQAVQRLPLGAGWAAVRSWAPAVRAAWPEAAAALREDVRALRHAGQRLAGPAARRSLTALRSKATAGAALVRQAGRLVHNDLAALRAAAIRAWARLPWPALQARLAPLQQAAVPVIQWGRGQAVAGWGRVRALASEAARRWQPARASAERLLARGRKALTLYSRRPQVLRYLVIADSALAASLISVWVVVWPAASPPMAGLALRSVAPAAAQRLQPTAAPAPVTAAPSPTVTPTSTPEPVLTATPIPTLFSEWASWLPEQGGWNGLSECWGSVLAPAGTGTFVWPTDKHYLVGYNYSWRWHPGLDLGGDIGDPIYASDSGVVVYAGWNVYGFGNLVILDHGNGWHTLYAHMSEIHVTCGQGVTQGALVGLAGSTGHSTGPHLHFEMRLNGNNVNPWDYLPTP